MSAVKYLWPTNRLRELVTQPGGKKRSDALAGAQQCLAESRGEADEGMRNSLSAIETILAEAKGAELSRDQVYAILQHTERMASIATIFDMVLVTRVVSSMADLGMSLLDASSRPCIPFAVHLRAAQWAADNSALSEAQAAPVLDGLLKVVGRFDERTRA